MFEVNATHGFPLVMVEKQEPAVGQTRTSATAPYAEIVEATKNGDRNAFGKLYEAFAPMVHGILLARLPYGEVNDIFQDVFLIAFKKIHTLREASAFGSWLAMIARNRAIDFYRRTHETEELTEELTRPAPMTAQASEALDAIRSLPEAYRETLILRLVEGMSGSEIAARTGLHANSVRVNLHRGMKLLRDKLTKEK